MDHFGKTTRGIEAPRRHGVRVGGCVVVTRLNAAVVDQILERFLARGATDVALSRYSPAGYAAEPVALRPPLGRLTTRREPEEARR
jgi:MoaA/NifB/PqqE/SkfB family radical SAM enzyme